MKHGTTSTTRAGPGPWSPLRPGPQAARARGSPKARAPKGQGPGPLGQGPGRAAGGRDPKTNTVFPNACQVSKSLAGTFQNPSCAPGPRPWALTSRLVCIQFRLGPRPKALSPVQPIRVLAIYVRQHMVRSACHPTFSLKVVYIVIYFYNTRCARALGLVKARAQGGQWPGPA